MSAFAEATPPSERLFFIAVNECQAHLKGLEECGRRQELLYRQQERGLEHVQARIDSEDAFFEKLLADYESCLERIRIEGNVRMAEGQRDKLQHGLLLVLRFVRSVNEGAKQRLEDGMKRLYLSMHPLATPESLDHLETMELEEEEGAKKRVAEFKRKRETLLRITERVGRIDKRLEVLAPKVQIKHIAEYLNQQELSSMNSFNSSNQTNSLNPLIVVNEKRRMPRKRLFIVFVLMIIFGFIFVISVTFLIMSRGRRTAKQ